MPPKHGKGQKREHQSTSPTLEIAVIGPYSSQLNAIIDNPPTGDYARELYDELVRVSPREHPTTSIYLLRIVYKNDPLRGMGPLSKFVHDTFYVGVGFGEGRGFKHLQDALETNMDGTFVHTAPKHVRIREHMSRRNELSIEILVICEDLPRPLAKNLESTIVIACGRRPGAPGHLTNDNEGDGKNRGEFGYTRCSVIGSRVLVNAWRNYQAQKGNELTVHHIPFS